MGQWSERDYTQDLFCIQKCEKRQLLLDVRELLVDPDHLSLLWLHLFQEDPL